MAFVYRDYVGLRMNQFNKPLRKAVISKLALYVVVDTVKNCFHTNHKSRFVNKAKNAMFYKIKSPSIPTRNQNVNTIKIQITTRIQNKYYATRYACNS